MSDFDSIFLPLCVAAGLLWLVMVLFAVGGSALARRRRRELATTSFVACDSPPQDAIAIGRQSAPSRVLGRAADAPLPAGAAAISPPGLAPHQVATLSHVATRRRRGLTKWRRVVALQKLAHAFGEGSFDDRIFGLLCEATRDPDRDIADSAVAIAGAMRDPRAAQLLVEALRDGASVPARVASQLDPFPLDVSDSLLPLLNEPDPVTRAWTARLLSRYRERNDIFARLVEMENDAVADVRSAVVRTLGLFAVPPEEDGREDRIAPEELRQRVEITGRVARHLVRDEAWFMRAQAARTLGALGRTEWASAVTPLLSDEQWWVRQAAKDALQSMGIEVAPQVVEVLDSSDAFARNGAAEVLQNLGFIDSVVQRLTQSDVDDGDARLLQKIYQVGGETMLEGALRDLSQTRQVEVWRLLRRPPAVPS